MRRSLAVAIAGAAVGPASAGTCHWKSCSNTEINGWCAESRQHCEGCGGGVWCGAPSPSPTPTPPGPPPPGTATYCPSAADFVVAYGNPQLRDQGWTVHGNGGAATAAAFNLLGGTVEFDIDFSAVANGVNANIYTISPHFRGSRFNRESDYCDGSMQVPWCMEVDWIESNGHCGGATTLHTKEQNGGEDGCTSWGCRTSYEYNGKSAFHMKIEYGTDGTWTTIRDGQVIDGGTMNPHPGSDSWAVVKSTYESRGGVIYSSEWTGWVPESPPCPGNAGHSELAASHFTVSNLKITGSVVQGPPPRACGSDLESETVIV